MRHVAPAEVPGRAEPEVIRADRKFGPLSRLA